MKNSNNEIISIIQESYNTMLEKGVRSNKKLKMIHSFIADKIKSKLSEFGEDIEVFSIGTDENSKEIAVAGAYYNKNVDIAVRYQNQDVSGISIKFITGNYKQNSINYFEHLLGETANLKTNGYKYASLYILPSYMPYYTNKKILKKIEEVTNHDIHKYLKINEERDLYHKPDIICILMIDTGTKDFLQQNIGKSVSNKDLLSVNKVSQLNYDEYNFDSKVHKFLINHSNLDSFFNAFVSLTKFNIYGK
jgi:hypothetical protein